MTARCDLCGFSSHMEQGDGTFTEHFAQVLQALLDHQVPPQLLGQEGVELQSFAVDAAWKWRREFRFHGCNHFPIPIRIHLVKQSA